MGRIIISLFLCSVLVLAVSGCASSGMRSPAGPSVAGTDGAASSHSLETQKRPDPRSKSLFDQVRAPSTAPSKSPSVRAAGSEMKAMRAKGPIVVIYPQ